jgi:hypothetical protein
MRSRIAEDLLEGCRGLRLARQGPIAIDPETRDSVHNEYLRELRKVGVETIATVVKDSWKELQKNKDAK